MISRFIARGLLVVGAALASNIACATLLYTNGFETNTVDWNSGATRVASGTDGVTSATGSFHAEATAGAFTRWGGYNFGAGSVPTTFQEFRTSLDIYLDVGGNFANDRRFDFTSAVSAATGGHRRDFAFNAGFYDDADNTGPGAGTDRFVISAGNNTGRANSFPKNSGAIAIQTSGWYTFEHHFYDLGGVLAVDMEISDAADVVVASWTLSSAADLIALIGGNRYGWFPNLELPELAIDNGFLEIIDATAVPEPASLALVGLALLGLAARRRSIS